MLDKVKLALRKKSDAFNEEIQSLINAAMLDLGIAGVETDLIDAVIERAVITYCKMHFGDAENYDQLKKSYDEQKAQLSMSSDYTMWGDEYCDSQM